MSIGKKIIIGIIIPGIIVFLLIFGVNSDQWLKDKTVLESINDDIDETVLEPVNDDIDRIICEDGKIIPRACEFFCDDQRFLEMCLEDVKKANELP